MSEPVKLGDITHIERSPLPWRPERSTECGLDATRHPTWTRDEAAKLAKDLGRQRFSMIVCMTCFGTADRHSTWEEDPASCMVRHAQRMTQRWGREYAPEKRRFADELRAIATLVERHRDEFDALVGDYGEVMSIGDAQRFAATLRKGGGSA